jgi:sugar fermentation stimulation protein A
MHFPEPLIEGRLVRRYKRFLADIELPGGQIIVAHCPNPGSMHTCAPERARVWLTHRPGPTRKLAYTWELCEAHGALVCVNTSRANDVVAEALQAGAIAELAGYDRLTREVRCRGSRIDFLLNQEHASCYVEVKSATLAGGDQVVAFPDAVTARGTRHLLELMALAAEGHRAVLLFCCNRSGARAVRPADEIDPLYGYTLRQAMGAGVEVLAYRSELSPRGIWLGQRIAVDLPPFPPSYTPPRTPPRRARPALPGQTGVKLGAKKKVRLVPPSPNP